MTENYTEKCQEYVQRVSGIVHLHADDIKHIDILGGLLFVYFGLMAASTKPDECDALYKHVKETFKSTVSKSNDLSNQYKENANAT